MQGSEGRTRLVLTRRVDESIDIQVAGGVRVKVVRIRGGSVRLCVEAPPAVKVLRSELEDSDAGQ